MTNDPKSAELSAAVERLRRGFTYGSCPDGWGECCDARLVAEHYLATVAADEDVEIDEAWLRSVGFGDWHGRGWLAGPAPCTGIEILMSDPPGCNKVSVFGHVLHWYLQTRGQLRRLCAALNIPLQPSEQEQSK